MNKSTEYLKTNKFFYILLLIISLMLNSLQSIKSQTVFTTEVSVDGRTYYDVQSNGLTRYINQNPINPNEIHAIFMVATDPPPNYTTRNIRYFYTVNGGNSWDYMGTVSQTRSGFPSLTTTSDNRAIIMAHANDGGGLLRCQVWIDLAPGIGSWSFLDPGTNGNTTIAPIWPEAAFDPVNNKLLWAASHNGFDSCFLNVCTNLNQPGTFIGYKPIINGENAEQYAPAVGTGVYGIAFNNQSGGASLIESFDQGVTWGAPQTILNWNPADSNGTLRSIDLRYNGTVPQVVIGLCRVDPVGGNFSPGFPSKVVYWSPSVNGGNPVKIDSASGLNGINPNNGVFFSICRPVIGYSSDGSNIYVAYCKVRTDTSELGNNYFDIYISCSGNEGASWSAPFRVTNNSGPLRDCRYVSISNKNGLYNGQQAVNLIYQSDSVPGSGVNGAPQSLARMMYARVTNLSCAPIGITNTGNQTPKNFNLRQNYPNPFNPSTQIEFSVPFKADVKITIYNSIGEEVTVLLNQNLSSGNYKVDWDAAVYPSGVYFYELKTNEYAETKKMVLIK